MKLQRKSRWKLRLLVSTLILSCGMHSSVYAWNPEGHQIIGDIADRLLMGTRAGERVRRLLNNRSLAQVSVWADCVKGISTDGFHYNSPGKYPECAPFENEQDIEIMRDYVRRNHNNCSVVVVSESCHKQYHYTDIAVGYGSENTSHYALGKHGSEPHDVAQAIVAAITVLQGKKAPLPFQLKNPTEALMLLSHLVGDIHQPLHVGAIYLDAQGNSVNPDQISAVKNYPTVGGNALLFESTNLHAMWDAIPARLRQNAKREQFIAFAVNTAKIRLQENVSPEISSNVKKWPIAWANDSLHDAEKVFDGVHFGTRELTAKGFRWMAELPPHYDDRMNQIKEAALIRAGVRLAQILQAITP